MSTFKTVHQIGNDEIVINKSRFIGHAAPIESEEEAIDFINSIKRQFKDASHNVHGYVLGENSNIQRFSDDGEPSGTAGMPVLNVIKSENLRNVCVVVTRYFGGVKLGAGGLVRAYTKGAKIGLESSIIVDKTLFYDVAVKIDYTLLGKVENDLNKSNFIIKEKTFDENVILNVLCLEEEIDKLTSLIMNATNGKCELKTEEAIYYSIKDGKVL